MNKRKYDNDDQSQAVKQFHAQDQLAHEILFESSFASQDLRLVELPQDILSAINSGEHLVIKGQSNGKDVVLCTNSKTYEMKRIENSNTILLVKPSCDRFLINAQTTAIYELTFTNPRLNQIKEVLKPTEYSDETDLTFTKENSIDQSDVYNNVQASELEISSSISDLEVVENNGKMRLVSSKKYREAVRCLMDTILENSWSLNDIDENQCRRQTPQIDPLLLQIVLRKLGTQSEDLKRKIWILNYEKVARACAHDLFINHMIINPNKQLWPCDDFIMSWSARTPNNPLNNNSIPSDTLLRGIALVEEIKLSLSDKKSATSKQYRYLPKEDLSHDAKTRFIELFAIRNSYTLDDISPYLDDLYGRIGQPKSLVALLLIYTKHINNVYQLK